MESKHQQVARTAPRVANIQIMQYTLAQKLTALPLVAQQKLQSILCSIPDSRKELFIEPALIAPLQLVCGANWLSQHGVARICRFDATQTPRKHSLLVYMISPTQRLFDQVLAQIRDICAHQPQHAAPELQDHTQFHIIAVPALPGAWAAIAEQEGLAGQLQLHRFNWDFLPLDTGVLSCEIAQLYREVFVRGETGLLTAVAQSMRVAQMVLGRPPVVLTYGQHAELVVQALLDTPAPTPPPTNGAAAAAPMIDAMLVIDRDRDYASTLLTPVVYAGLLMDVWRCSAGRLTTDAAGCRIGVQQLGWLRCDAAGVKPGQRSEIKMPSRHLRLNSRTDSIYAEQRFRPFVQTIRKLAGNAKEFGDEREQVREMPLNDMQRFVTSKLPLLAARKRELVQHMAMCETIFAQLGDQYESVQEMQENMLHNEQRKQTLQRIEEQLATDPNRTQAIRQMALMYVTCGLAHEEATAFVQNYLNAFGYGALPAFTRLADVGLFPPLDGGSKLVHRLNTLNTLLKQTAFEAECGKLKLLPKEKDKDKPKASDEQATVADQSSDSASKTTETCPSYVFNGAYIPLVAQLAQLLLNAQRFEDFASRTVHADQLKLWRFGEAATPAAMGRHPAELVADVRSAAVADLMPLQGRTVWLHVVGGVTMAEIAAADAVGRQAGGTVVVTSDRLVAFDDLVQAVFAEGDE